MRSVVWGSAGRIAGNTAIAAFLVLFVIANIRGFNSTGDWSYGLVALNESIYALLFLVRSRASATSHDPFDWGVAFTGTFISTLSRPALPLDAFAGNGLIALGTLCNIVAVASLNRSIGIVAAKREVKSRGLYRFVRHPMYVSGIIAQVGYLLRNLSLLNASVALAVLILLILRAQREERFLGSDPDYARYKARVRYRFVPGVF